jgi:2-methylcitrate dehydratase PrpD
LKLDENQTEYALGLAADQAAGLRYCIDKGDYSKSLHPGFAAMRGVMLALLVQKGANGPRGILEYPTGFCHAFSEDPEIEKTTEGLGRFYELNSNSLKAYPTILCSHSSIQAVQEMMKEHAIDHSEILKVHLRISEKKVSLNQFNEEKLGDPRINDLMERIEIEDDPSLNRKYPETLASVVEIETKGKGTLRHEVIYPKGNRGNPLLKEDVAEKFREQCSLSLPKDQYEELLEMLLNLDQLHSVEKLIDLLRRKQ